MRELIGAFEEHTLPDGSRVYYRDRDHSYWSAIKTKAGDYAGTGRLTGVSTVVAPFDWRPDNLMRWAARQNCDGIATLAADGLSLEDAEDMRVAFSFLTSGDSIWQALSDGRLLYSDRRDDAAARGTNVHKFALGALADGHPVPALASMSEEERGYARGVMAFWHELEPEPLSSETIVCDRDLAIAGRLDLIATLHGTYRGRRFNGERCLIDAKTSGFIPAKHHAQVAGYAHCAQACGFEACDVLLILQVGADGSYELIDVTATSEDFQVVVDLYRRAARINRDAGRDRKTKEAIAA
jgi:hypothetical protein